MIALFLFMQNTALKVFSARARESALRVRRHQDALGASEQPTGMANPKIRARVAEILAAKQKGKAKAKGKGKKAPDPAKAKAKAERAKAAIAKKAEREKAKVERAGKQLSAATARETAKRERATAKAERVAAQAKKQAAQQKKLKQAAQAKRAKDKASATAKQERTKTATAAQAKRKQAAKERIAAQAKKQSEAQAKQKQATADRTAKQKQAQQHKTRVLSEKIKRGEKLSASDQVDAEDAGLVKRAGTKAMTKIEIDDSADTDISALQEIATGALSAIKAGARHNKMDASHLDEAARHLHAAGATCPDCAPDEEDDGDEAAGKAIKSIMDNPAWYAQHECNDIMQAGSALSTLAMLIQSELSEEDEDDADVSQLCDAARTLIKFIGSELDELEGAAGDAAEGRTAGDVPMAKGADDAWLHMDGGEIKAADDDTIKGLAVLYATKATHDLEKDYYDKNSDLWLDHWGWPRPITYHHGMDAGTRDDPVVGHWTKATVTDEGVWLEGQLDRAHRYYKAVKELARRGYLKISSDSGPQWVIREPQTNGANYIKRWPLVSASVTVTPMEPRMFPVEVKAFLAELGYEAIDTDSPEAIKANSDRGDGLKAESERARRLSIQQRMIHLRETMNGPTS